MSSTLEPFFIITNSNNVVRKKTIKKKIYMNPYEILTMKFCTNPYEIYGYRCPNKNKLLRLDRFWKDSRRQDGRIAACIDCGTYNNKNRNCMREIKAAIPADMKHCTLCLELLPLDKFTIKNSPKTDKGRASRCRECTKKGLDAKWDAMSTEEKETKKKIRSIRAKELLEDMKKNDLERYAEHCERSKKSAQAYRDNPANHGKLKALRKKRYWETPMEIDGVVYKNGKARDKVYRDEYFSDPELGEKRIANSKEKGSKWKKENRDKADATVARRRAKKAGNEVPDTWEPADENIIKEIYKINNKMNKEAGCQRSNEPHPEGRCWGSCAAYNVDHIWSIEQGGPHHQDNLRITYASENKSKWSYHDEERDNILYDFYRKGYYTNTKEGKKTFIKEEMPPAPRTPLVSFIGATKSSLKVKI